jgi:hypothetical protein
MINCKFFVKKKRIVSQFSWMDLGKTKNTPVAIAGVSAEMRTEHLPNTEQEH